MIVFLLKHWYWKYLHYEGLILPVVILASISIAKPFIVKHWYCKYSYYAVFELSIIFFILNSPSSLPAYKQTDEKTTWVNSTYIHSSQVGILFHRGKRNVALIRAVSQIQSGDRLIWGHDDLFLSFCAKHLTWKNSNEEELIRKWTEELFDTWV